MFKFGVAFARVMLVAAAASAVAVQAQTPAATIEYPVKLANGFSVNRGSQIGREYCVVNGVRAMPAAGTESGSVTISTEIAFNEKGESGGYGEIRLDLKETSFTNTSERPVTVRVELDGVAQDMPYGEVHQAIFTFLTIRFPAEYLNKLAVAKVMKVYTVDATTKAAKLFATADVSGFAKAADAHAKCTAALPTDFPKELGDGWELTREADRTCSLAMTGRHKYAVVRDTKGHTALVFTEVDEDTELEKPVVSIGGSVVKSDYAARFGGNLAVHVFEIAAKDFEGLKKDVKLEISSGGEPHFGGANLYPPVGLLYLDKCVASLKALKATASK